MYERPLVYHCFYQWRSYKTHVVDPTCKRPSSTFLLDISCYLIRLTYLLLYLLKKLMDCRVQCVKLPGISCLTGTARSFRNGALVLRSTTRWRTTRWFVSPGRTSDSPRPSGLSLTNTAGHTSCSYQTLPLCISAGPAPRRSTPSSAATQTTRTRGSDSLLIRRTNNSTTFYSRYDH